LVEKRMIRREQVVDAASLEQHARQEQANLGLEVLAQREAEAGLRRHDLIELVDVEPCYGEVFDERLRSVVREHALDLTLHDARLRQLPVVRELEQLVVGALAPEEERQARRELKVVEQARRAGL